MWLLYVGVPRLGRGGALLISVVTICRGSRTWWREGIIDQCGYYMSGFQDLVEGGIIDQCGYYMSGFQDLVEGGHY